jgi:hypothetical protein
MELVGEMKINNFGKRFAVTVGKYWVIRCQKQYADGVAMRLLTILFTFTLLANSNNSKQWCIQGLFL